MPRTIRILTTILLVLVATVALTSSLSAQEDPADLAHITRVDVAPEQQAAFEAGVERHLEVLREQGADREQHAWEIVVGEDAGSYYVGTFGHTWSDFDDPPVDDPDAVQESLGENIAPHIESYHPGVWRLREDVSWPDPEADDPTMLVTVLHVEVKVVQGEAFENALERMKQAAEETDYTDSYWSVYQLLHGGGPVGAIASDASSWADLAPPEITLGEMVEEAMGETEAQEVFEQLFDSIESMRTEIWRYREDLSLLPEER